MVVTSCSIQKYLKPVRRRNLGREESRNCTPNDRLRSSSSSHLNENALFDYPPCGEDVKCKSAVGTLLLQNSRREEIEATKEDGKSLEIISLPPPSISASKQRRVIFDQSSHASAFQNKCVAARSKCIFRRGFATNISLLSQATNDEGEQKCTATTKKGKGSQEKKSRTNINSIKTRGRLAEIDHMKQVYIAQQKRHNLSHPDEIKFFADNSQTSFISNGLFKASTTQTSQSVDRTKVD